MEESQGGEVPESAHLAYPRGGDVQRSPVSVLSLRRASTISQALCDEHRTHNGTEALQLAFIKVVEAESQLH